MAREGCVDFCSAQTYTPLCPQRPPLGPSPPPPAWSRATRMRHNERLFLAWLPALCQMYSHLRYNCQHVFNPQRALIKVEFK